jgi:cleavage and polyadenylation specificity factor subunit 1
MLQSKMTTQLQHVAGLNPRAYRMVQPNFGSRVTQPSKNILDAGLLYRFISLPITERRVLAAQIGSTEASILQDLQEIKRSVAVF